MTGGRGRGAVLAPLLEHLGWVHTALVQDQGDGGLRGRASGGGGVVKDHQHCVVLEIVDIQKKWSAMSRIQIRGQYFPFSDPSVLERILHSSKQQDPMKLQEKWVTANSRLSGQPRSPIHQHPMVSHLHLQNPHEYVGLFPVRAVKWWGTGGEGGVITPPPLIILGGWVIPPFLSLTNVESRPSVGNPSDHINTLRFWEPQLLTEVGGNGMTLKGQFWTGDGTKPGKKHEKVGRKGRRWTGDAHTQKPGKEILDRVADIHAARPQRFFLCGLY